MATRSADSGLTARPRATRMPATITTKRATATRIPRESRWVCKINTTLTQAETESQPKPERVSGALRGPGLAGAQNQLDRFPNRAAPAAVTSDPVRRALDLGHRIGWRQGEPRLRQGW